MLASVRWSPQVASGVGVNGKAPRSGFTWSTLAPPALEHFPL